MRYFFSLALAKAALAVSIGVASSAGRAVANRRLAQRLAPRCVSTALKTVDMTAVAVLTDEHLAMTTGTVEHPG
jgi:hypothetical protein